MTKKNKKIEHSEREHLECGGSGAHRWLRCTASVFLGRQVGKLPPTKAAMLGTDTHELAEICLSEFLDHKLLGEPESVRYNKEKLLRSEDQVAAAEMYRDYIWNEVLGQSITNKAWGIEDKIVHPKCDKLGGSPDFWAVNINDKGQRVLHIADFKNGTNPVDIKHEQFPYYGICFRAMLREKGKDIDRLETYVIQPNSMDGCTTANKSYTSKQLDVLEAKIFKAIDAIYVKQQCIYKTGHWCTWCPGESKCKKRGKEIEIATGLSLIDNDITVPEVSSLTNEQIVALALHGDKIASLVKACKANIVAAHMRGESMGGCKVIQSNPRRSLPKDTTELEARLKKEGLQDEDLYNVKLKGIGALESLLGAKKKNLLEKFVTRGLPTASVVSLDDPRPEAVDLSSLLID